VGAFCEALQPAELDLLDELLAAQQAARAFHSSYRFGTPVIGRQVSQPRSTDSRQVQSIDRPRRSREQRRDGVVYVSKMFERCQRRLPLNDDALVLRD
jgi:hypothetical protein